MPDKSDEILQKLQDLNSIVTQLAEHKIQIMNLAEWQREYRDKQIPKCDTRFENTNIKISDKISGVYAKLWWIVGTFITILLVIIGFVIKDKP